MSGDGNGDGGIDLSDAVYLLDFLFQGGPAPLPACPAAPLPGPSELCPTFACSGDLLCLRFWQLRIILCTSRCETEADCEGYGPDPCCVVPGPQTLDGYCVSRDWFPDVCKDF